MRTYNLDSKLEYMYNHVTIQATYYRTNNILLTFGCDFTYMNADKNFKNSDKLIKYMNERYDDVNFMYSTPNQYIDYVKRANATFPVRYDDMLPVSSSDHSYWTGSYTSRPNFKSFTRYAGEDFNTQSLAFALDSILPHSENETAEIMSAYDKLYSEISIMQHHDAITGTSRDYVMHDFADRLYLAQQTFRDQFLKSIANLIQVAGDYQM